MGINDAGPGRHPLQGAVNDVEAAEALLRAAAVDSHQLRTEILRDSDATRDAIVTSLRTLADQVGPDDTVLFWFSGNGSTVEAPTDEWRLFPGGRIPTLICHSNDGGRAEITATELTDFASRITDQGTHVVVVVDGCHSGLAPYRLTDPPLNSPSEAEPSENRQGSHVTLSACLPHERAQEIVVNGRWHGAFSWALLRAMARLGPTATYRELISATRREMDFRSAHQTPFLSPASDTVIDQPFLGGAVRQPASLTVMNWGQDGWWINIGACHGVPAAPGTRVTTLNTSSPREAEVVEVRAVDSLVEPIGWEPERHTQYPVVVSTMATVLTTVVIDPAARRVREALHAAGPSPLVREATSGETPDLHVVAAGDTAAVLVAGDEPPLQEGIVLDAEGARRTVGTLEHVARWRLIYLLENPLSGLAGAVRIEVVPAQDAETRVPAQGTFLQTDAHGVIRLRARRTGSNWQPPAIFVRLRNLRDEPLYCALLDLTSMFAVRVNLFPGDFIGPRRLAAAAEGRRLAVHQPDGKPIRPGGRDRTWLKLMVCRTPFSVEQFALPPIGRRSSTSRLASPSLLSAVGRLAVTESHDAATDPSPTGDAYDWWTTMIPIEVVYD
ncbi:caspase family protein [Actinoplanes campanulatus]|uniref:caspase family protein n=1 Tax=Actinoplanes campanulatus TaxID=113559 RepID=UPI001953DD08|nr:caspase family protein [Actinoplanes capillaceus]